MTEFKEALQVAWFLAMALFFFASVYYSAILS